MNSEKHEDHRGGAIAAETDSDCRAYLNRVACYQEARGGYPVAWQHLFANLCCDFFYETFAKLF
jgi:hypothetical protein